MRDGNRPTRSRRRVLATVATTGIAALAGCSGDDGPSTPTPTDETPVGTDPPATPTPTETPVTPTPTPLADASFAERSEQFVELLADGEYEMAWDRTSGPLAAQLSPADLRQLWATMQDRYGEFQGTGDPETRPAANGVAVVVPVRFADGDRLFRFVFGQGDGGLTFVPTETPESADADSSIIGLLILAPYSPAEYVDRDAFDERSLELTATGDCSLPARLSLPTGESSVPGVVIVHGSGPADRDSALGATRPYRDLAWGLASRGVAVLRYDKRTRQCAMDPAETTIDSVVVDDALSTVERLRDHDRVDEVAVAGHSFGGALAPLIARRDGDLAGTVHLAANARPLHRLLLAQNEFLANADAQVTDEERQRIEQIREGVRRIEDGEVAPGETVLGAPGAFWESLLDYDRFETARSLSLPMRFLQGTADWQVTVDEDLSRWRSELDRENVSAETFEGLTHRFAEDRNHPAGAAAAGNVARAVVEDVASWL